MALFDEMMQGLDEVDGFLAGKQAGYRVSVPEQVDVKSIRKRLHMTQAGFSAAFGFSLDAVKHWEGGRRTPESSARAFLTVISKNPMVVLGALHSEVPKAKAGKVSSGKVSVKTRTNRVVRSVRRAA